MGFFGKNKRNDDDRPMTAAELMERSKVDGIRYRDLEVVAQLVKQGSNLEARRHLIFYLYFPEEQGAQTVAEVLRGRGLNVDVREPWEKVPNRTVVAESQGHAIIPNFLRETIDICEELAQKHGGEYDGWEAGPDLA